MAIRYKIQDVRHPVEVTWNDTMATSGWQNDMEAATLLHQSIGYLVKQPLEDRVVIVRSKGRYSFGEAMEIPKSCVKKIRRLR